MRSNQMEYSTAAGPYCTTNDVKMPFCMPSFSSSKIILHHFYIDNNEGESGIGYDMIIGRDLMVQLGLLVDFKRQLLQWYGLTVPMKEPSGLIGQIDITSCEMCEVVMRLEEPVSTRESTERLMKILEDTYVKAELEHLSDNETQINDEERTKPLRLLQYFEDFLMAI